MLKSPEKVVEYAKIASDYNRKIIRVQGIRRRHVLNPGQQLMTVTDRTPRGGDEANATVDIPVTMRI
jgi:hypothetical protein